MRKRIAQVILIITLLSSAIIITSQNTSLAVTSNPAALKIFAYPPNVLADNKTYNSIFVQLQDSTGKPARALQNITISLASSDTYIGTVDPTLTILNGTTFASANFKTTFSPGTTVISAAANGYETVRTTMKTIAPFPVAVSVYGFPSTLPADGGSYDAIMVQLQDMYGKPAIAPKGGVFVSLSSSNTTVGTVSPNVTIPEGNTYAKATFNTTIQNGTAIITSVPQGYVSEIATITTTTIVANATQLKLYVGPNQLLADQNSYKQIVVELQDVNGSVANCNSDVLVSLASSDPSIGKIESQIIIPANQTFKLTAFNTTYKPGTTTITIAANDFQRDQQLMTTNGYTPSQLAIYCVPPTLPCDNGTYPTIIVQLQDFQERPARDPVGDIILKFFSSQPTVASVNTTLTIPFGQTQVTGNITVTNSPGSAEITVQASGYTIGQSILTTLGIDYLPLNVTAAVASANVTNGQKTEVTVFATANGNAVPGASVKFTSDNNGSFSSTTDLGNGYYKTTFTSPSFAQATTCTITANVTKAAYISSEATIQVLVQPPPPTPTPMPSPTATPTPSPTPAPTASPTPTPKTNSTQNTNSTAPSTGNATGTIQMFIQDNQGKPIIDANVSSTKIPEGSVTLSGVTNSSGLVVFKNITVGQYSFKILKDGYNSMNKSVTFKDKPVNMTFSLISQDPTSGSNDGSNWSIIVVIVIVVVVVAVAVGVILLKRRASGEDEFDQYSESSDQ